MRRLISRVYNPTIAFAGVTESQEANLVQALRSICIPMLLAAFCAGPAFSQAVNATLVGTITDVGCGMVPRAKVTITEMKTGVSQRADTARAMEAVLTEELPLGVNRNFQTLLELVPGTTESTFQHSQFFNASSSLQTNLNGQARMGNDYQIEGIDNNERTGLLQILIPPAESIQMVSVSTTNHDPELGRASGASSGLANHMARFLLGIPANVGRDVNTYFPALRAWQLSLFAADNWQVSPRLTVNLGARWEFYPPATPAFPGGFSNYDFNKNDLVIAGVGDNPMNLGMVTHDKYFAPRVGIAYRLSPNIVIRTGFGLSYAPYPDNTYAYNYPVRANNSYQTAGVGTKGVDTASQYDLNSGFILARPPFLRRLLPHHVLHLEQSHGRPGR